MTHSALYRGALTHVRRDAHATRTFRYPVYTAALDLAELPALDADLRLFSRGRRNLFAFDERDYDTHPAALADLRAANDLPAAATTRLVTNLRVLGYVFNPVSFFLGYDAGGALTSAIAEVNNTYGGRFRYLLGPAHRLPARPGAPDRVGFRHVRELFVSPFLHGPARYELWFPARVDADPLAITMHVDRSDDSRVFTAHLAGTRAPLTDRALAAAALRYPWMTAQVTALIHLEALRLRLRGVPYRRPDRGHRPLGFARSTAAPDPAPTRVQ